MLGVTLLLIFLSIICKFLASYIKKIRTGDSNESDITYWMFSYDFKLKNAIIMGSEGVGINKSVLKLCDQSVNIPLHGKISSLNVSVATGIILSEIKRQKN